MKGCKICNAMEYFENYQADTETETEGAIIS